MASIPIHFFSKLFLRPWGQQATMLPEDLYYYYTLIPDANIPSLSIYPKSSSLACWGMSTSNTLSGLTVHHYPSSLRSFVHIRANNVMQVVVDDINFRVGNFKIRDTPIQIDRARDILQPPIKKAAFKIVRNSRLPSGKSAPLCPPPISAFSPEPYVEQEDFTVSIRGNQRDHWAAEDPLTGEKLDFQLHLHSERMKPIPHKVCARKKHPPMTALEMHGPRWETRGAERTMS